MTALTRREAVELFRTPATRTVRTASAEVPVRSVGEGPDVVFVHGWPVSGATFRTLLPLVTGEVRCHILDLPGAGDSVFDRTTRFGIHDHATAVRRVVDDLGLQEFSVVAHDSGGLIARHALAGDPRVVSWGLLDTEQPQGVSPQLRSFLSLSKIPKFETILAWLVNSPRLRRNNRVLGGSFHDLRLLDGEFEEFFLRPLRENRERRWAAGQLARHFDISAIEALAGLHRKIEVPVQLVYGRKDPFFPADWTEQMVETFAGPTALHFVENGRLFSHEEFPQETAQVLLETLLHR